MKFTDTFINKPVLATVVSLFILLLGLRSAVDLNIRQYPELQNAVITITTIYVGADADLIQGFITTPLEQEIASADGIDYLTSRSVAGASTIQAFIRLDYDANQALTQIVAKVNKLRSQLPTESEDPSVELAVGDDLAAMYLSFSSDILDNNQITDYIVRVVQPKLSTVPGVQRAAIIGDRTYAIRAWLKPDRMAAFGITPSDIFTTIPFNSALAPVGQTLGSAITVDIKADTDMNSLAEFKNVVIKTDGDTLIRLQDVADVELGSASYSTSVTFNGQMATFMGIEVAPDANSLDVIADVRDMLNSDIFPQLPVGMEGGIPYDSTEYIEDSIDEVIQTIIEAVLIVIAVIYLFLGNLRSVFIPAVAVPLSLVGALFLMQLMGFSINLLTLLAMVLAIGIVVDDAIIVLENIHRHIEEGMSPYDAAIQGTRELAWPVVAMTTTLIAVYIPIGFIGGLTGTLFVEFAFTLAGSVLLSGIVALTLSPMMCSRLLKAHSAEANESNTSKFEQKLNVFFDNLQNSYEKRLHTNLGNTPVVITFGAIVLVSCFFLFMMLPAEIEPAEDRGFVLTFAEGDPNANLNYTERFTNELNIISDNMPANENLFLLNGLGNANSALSGFVMKPWNERDMSTHQAVQFVTAQTANIAGLRFQVFSPPTLPSAGGGLPVQFVIGSTDPHINIAEIADDIASKAFASGKFFFVGSDLKINKPRYELKLDKAKVSTIGLSSGEVGQELTALIAGSYATRFSMDNRSYKVIPQIQRSDRLSAEQLGEFQIRTRNDDMVPLSTFLSVEQSVQPQSLNRFQQLNSAIIGAVPKPGITQDDALSTLEGFAKEVLPSSYSVDYSGQSRQFKQEGNTLTVTLFFALVVIFLILAAQFESWRDPLIMLVTVPMSIAGALLVLMLIQIINFFLFPLGIDPIPGASINIYTQVGLVTLIGVISKHGILIVEFANQLQADGLSKREAIEKAAAIRLRPVLMTTASLVLAMIPLLLASGPGGSARFAIGVVVASGMTLGTLFTLFVVPGFYMLLAKDHQTDHATA